MFGVLRSTVLGVRRVSGSVGVWGYKGLGSEEKGESFYAKVFEREDEPREVRMKRLRYAMTHRGLVENEILLFSFFKAHGDGLTDAQLHDFERLLCLQDQDLLNLIVKRETPEQDDTSPEEEVDLAEIDGELLEALQDHANTDVLATRRADPFTYIA